MASHLSTRWQAQLLHSSCRATSPLSNEVWGLVWFRRTLREEHGGTFLVEVHAINHRVTPSPRPSQVKTQCFYLQLLQGKPQVSHPLRLTAELPPPKAPVVLTAPVGLVVSPALLQVQETLLGLHTACLHKPFRCGIRCCRCVTLDMNVWPNGVTFHNNGAEAKSLF